MAVGDWIKVHRSIRDSAVWDDPGLLKLWMWCRMKANYRPSVFRGTPVGRGQFVTGQHTGAEEMQITPSKWYRGMTALQEMGHITMSANSRFTVVTVCDYDTCDECEVAERIACEQPVNSQRIAGEQPVNSQRIAGEQPVNSPRIQEKEEQEGKNNTSARAQEAGLATPLRTWKLPSDITDPLLVDAIDRWQAFWACTTGRPMIDLQIETMYANKRSAGWDDAKLVRSINKSIEWGAKSWRDPDNDHDQPRQPAVNGRHVKPRGTAAVADADF